MSRLSLKDALQLVHRYGDCGSPKFEAALKGLSMRAENACRRLFVSSF